MERRQIAWAALAAVALTLGAGFPVRAQVPPPSVAISGADGQLTQVFDCTGGSETSLDPATLTLTRTGDATDPLIVDLVLAGPVASGLVAPLDPVTIGAGETTATVALETGTTTGTATASLSDASAPGTFSIVAPGTVSIRVLEVIATPGCIEPTTTSSSAPSTEPGPSAPRAPAAQPVRATAGYTG